MLHKANQPHRIIPASIVELLADENEATRSEKLKEIARNLAGNAPHVATSIITGMARTAEALLLVIAAAIAYKLYPATAAHSVPIQYVVLVVTATVLTLLSGELGGLYRTEALLNPVRRLPRLLAGITIVFAILLAAIVFGKLGVQFSRVWLGSWFVASVGLLCAGRLAASRLLAHWNENGQLARRAVIVGGGEPAGEVLEALNRQPNSDVSVIGLFDDRSDLRSPNVVSGYAKLGSIAELTQFVRDTRVDLLIVTLPLHAETRLSSVLNQLWVLPVDIRLSAYSQKLRYRPRTYSYIGAIPLLDLFDKPLHGWDTVLKAIEDRVLASLALVFALPVMALVALAIKLESRGPVLFKQKRYGFNNELIEIYKFRSMYVDQCDATAAQLVTRGDPRVTRVGRFIRRTSLDELPQLFNVLKGDLSLVGPRPHATQAKAHNSLYDQVVEGYFARHKVKPGITGWAQVNGWRGETDTVEKIQKRVEHDLYYIENWSILFDLVILARTPISLLGSKGAY